MRPGFAFLLLFACVVHCTARVPVGAALSRGLLQAAASGAPSPNPSDTVLQDGERFLASVPWATSLDVSEGSQYDVSEGSQYGAEHGCVLAAEALKIFQQGSRNIMSLQSQGLQGWADPTGAATNPCQGWTGVTCDSSNRVVAL